MREEKEWVAGLTEGSQFWWRWESSPEGVASVFLAIQPMREEKRPSRGMGREERSMHSDLRRSLQESGSSGRAASFELVLLQW
ncbi:hypothetical protein PR202_gb27332 [Eleusine coracana subsp. coracana]|uniref:Uncharacterized protein n=1 Tax=Eleusine coracana subsp. coracana TaxID=191504 RepID=A0AAV5FU45_ELECO|nr:hypothetical protein PR202_gb27332 [Eleusine coracana subsp. coracana]